MERQTAGSDFRIPSQIDAKTATKAVGLAAMTAGILDFLHPTLSVFISSHSASSVIRLWQFVASGVFGKSAYSMGMVGVLCGVVFHFLIATIFSAAIYFLYVRLSVIRKHYLLSGLTYGAGMWLVMNLLVVPLSNAGRGLDSVNIRFGMIFNMGFAWHMVLGLSLVFIIKKVLDGSIASNN